MPLPDDDRQALTLRLDALAPGAVDAVAKAIEEGEELRDVLVASDGKVVAVTSGRVLVVAATKTRRTTSIELGAVDLQRRDSGLGIDAKVTKGRLALLVPRSTLDRLAALATGGAPGRASWLPPSTMPAAAPVVEDVPLETEVAPPVAPAPAAPAPPQRTWSSGSTVPVPAGPWLPRDGWARQAPTGSPVSGGPPPPPSVPPQPPRAALPPPGWHPDPSRNHWWRWWDGHDWTDHVADGGPPFLDPLPPRGAAGAGR